MRKTVIVGHFFVVVVSVFRDDSFRPWRVLSVEHKTQQAYVLEL